MKNTLRCMLKAVGVNPAGEVLRWRSVWEGSNPSGPAGGGTRERERRVRQIAKFQLTEANGLREEQTVEARKGWFANLRETFRRAA